MKKGLSGELSATAAFLSWGFLPIYWKTLKHIPPAQLLGHRIIWSSVFLFFLIGSAGKLPAFFQAFKTTRMKIYLILSTLFIGCNWYLFIWAVNNDHVLESSLGYFINPLFNFLMGTLFFGEKLRKAQWVAVGLAGLGVLYFTLTLGHFPWVGISLALTFCAYGVLRKLGQVDSLTGLMGETLLLCLPSLIYLIFISGGLFQAQAVASSGTTVLLLASGIITSLPLVWFGKAARDLPLTTLGFFQYLSPTCQFLVAVFLYHEPFTQSHAVTFAAIWLALIIYSIDRMKNRT